MAMSQQAHNAEKKRCKEREHRSQRTDRLSNPCSKYLTDLDLAARWTVSRDTAWRWTKLGKIPNPIKLGDNCTRWLRSEIEAWEAEQECQA
jgi:prophage regulatory protein